MEKKTPYNPNNKTELPLNHYLELFAAADPAEIASRTGVRLSGRRFTLNVLGEERSITWPRFDDEGWSDTDRILFVRFLLEGKKPGNFSGFAAYRDLPWGTVYETPFRGRCIIRMSRTYGTRPDAFIRACEGVGGVRLPANGIAYEIPFMPGLYLRFTLWEGDDEFPASAQILFSDNFPEAFSGEDRVFVCEYVLARMKKFG